MCGRTRISEHLRRPMEVLETQERWINWSKEVIEIICPVFWMCVLMYTLIHVHVLFWRIVLSFCKGAKNHWVYVCIYIHIHLIFMPTLRGRTSKCSVLCQVRCLSSLVSCIGQLLVINALELGVYREVLSPFCLTCQLIRHSLLCSSHLEYSAVWSFPEKNMLKKTQLFFWLIMGSHFCERLNRCPVPGGRTGRPRKGSMLELSWLKRDSGEHGS